MQTNQKTLITISVAAVISLFFISFFFLYNTLDVKVTNIKVKEKPDQIVDLKNYTTSSNGITVIADNKNTADELLNKAQNYRLVLPNQMGLSDYKLPGKITINVFSNEDDYTKETGKPLWSEGYADFKRNRINIIADSEDNSVLAHEISHLIFNSYMEYEDPYLTILDEGLAVIQQMRVDSLTKENIRRHLENIKTDKGWPLKTLGEVNISNKTDKDDIDNWYAQSASVVFYLRKKYGANKFELFLIKLKDKTKFEEALLEVYNININQLQDDWFKDLKTSKSYF